MTTIMIKGVLSDLGITAGIRSSVHYQRGVRSLILRTW